MNYEEIYIILKGTKNNKYYVFRVYDNYPESRCFIRILRGDDDFNDAHDFFLFFFLKGYVNNTPFPLHAPFINGF